MKNLGKWWNGLDSNSQFKFVILILIVSYLVWRFTLKPIVDDASSGASQGAQLALLSIRGVKPTHPDAIYSQTADMLYEAMKGFGTKEPTVSAVFAVMVNDADMIKLDQAFGKRPGIFREYTLSEWLTSDLTPAEILKINNALRNRGITKTI